MDKEKMISDLPIQKLSDAKLLKRESGYEDAEFVELAASIKKIGIIEPIIVVKEKEGWRVVAGMRRLRAASIAGLVTVPCIVKKLSKIEEAKIRWMENENRQNIRALERANFIEELMEKMKWSQTKVAKELMKSEAYISQHLGILRGYEIVRVMLKAGEITFSVARELNRSKSERIVNYLAEHAKGNNAGEKQVRLWVNDENSRKEVEVERSEDGEDEGRYVQQEIKEVCDVCGGQVTGTEVRWIKACNACRIAINQPREVGGDDRGT